MKNRMTLWRMRVIRTATVWRVRELRIFCANNNRFFNNGKRDTNNDKLYSR